MSIPLRRTLSRDDYDRAAAALGCERECVIAIAVVEGGDRGAFDEDGFPTVLFERHLFHRLTDGRFDAVAPDLSNAVAGGYGSYRAQKIRLDRATKLDREAALMATSWGLFQILGQWWERCGAADVQDFVNGMCSGASYHLDSLVAFLLADPGLSAALREHRWSDFARGYNGVAFARNQYDQHLQQAYELAKARVA